MYDGRKSKENVDSGEVLYSLELLLASTNAALGRVQF
jgi:hypothetical protein